METLNIIEDHYKYAQQNHDVPAMLEAIQQYVQVTAVFENNQN
ncbi:hypothetical protein [Solirubrum puertoriconensis]|nr:hypothetical protein [Solirubrum puertoriconensis]